MKGFRQGLIAVAVGATLAGTASGSFAAGFAIGTQSGSGTGNAFAGGAAAADDASVAWYNPAGIMLLPGKQISFALHALRPSFKYQDQGSTVTFAAQPAGTGGDGGDLIFVPNAFFAMAVNPRLGFGLALNAPFGLKTEYDPPWRGQLLAIKSEIKTANINPSVAFKASDTVSLGLGLNIQRIEAELTNCANAACTNVANLSADDTSYGANVGIMIQAAPSTRIGASYRSSIKYGLEGNVTFSAAPAGNGPIRADLKVPDSASISVFHALTPNWELLGDITWTGWSSVQQLVITRTNTGAQLTTLPFLWKDTWRFGIGANYRINDQMKMRFGAALDESPSNDVTRTPRLPDQDRTWVAVGMQYRVSKAGVLDWGYAHEFIRDARINAPVPGFTTCAAGCLRGSFKDKADIFSLQYSHSF